MIRVDEEDALPGAPVFTTLIPVRWGDMDADGHVNNTLYFRFMEETRMRWIAGLGLPTQAPHPVIVLRNAACRFVRPLGFPATVEVALAIGRVGRSSVQTHYTLRHVEASAVCAEGYATLVWYDVLQRCTVALPATLKTACGVA
jgi:acyl-CoA thioester hydrolase